MMFPAPQKDVWCTYDGQLFNVVKLTVVVKTQLNKIKYLVRKFYKHARRAKLRQLTTS